MIIDEDEELMWSVSDCKWLLDEAKGDIGNREPEQALEKVREVLKKLPLIEEELVYRITNYC